jgi:hypothetical protein
MTQAVLGEVWEAQALEVRMGSVSIPFILVLPCLMTTNIYQTLTGLTQQQRAPSSITLQLRRGLLMMIGSAKGAEMLDMVNIRNGTQRLIPFDDDNSSNNIWRDSDYIREIHQVVKPCMDLSVKPPKEMQVIFDSIILNLTS